MKRFAVFAGAFALLTLMPAATSGLRADPMQRVHLRRARLGLAKNWAGYVAHGGPFTSASTTWTEPSVTCPTPSSASASFAAIDGSGSRTVEQIGTLAICSNGRVTHLGFYEMFPRAPGILRNPVRAGDSMTATVTATSSKLFTLMLVNNTAGWTFSTQQRSSKAQRASAEAITEAPTIKGSGIGPLANFGSINYSATAANGQAISVFNPEQVTMVTSSGTVRAQPTTLSSGSFSVIWQHT
jgi:hypothetical protein